NWRHKGGTPYVPSPLLVDGKLYFTQMNDNLLTVLDAKTGKAIVEQERLPQVRSFYASPIAAAGRIYFVDRTGTTLVLKAAERVGGGSRDLRANRVCADLDERFSSGSV